MTGQFSLTYGNIATSALIICGIAALFGLAGRVVWYRVRVALDDHYYPARPELLDEYADGEDLTAVMDGLREYPDLDEDQVVKEDTGKHSLVPVAPQEMTGFMPVTSRVDGTHRLGFERDSSHWDVPGEDGFL